MKLDFVSEKTINGKTYTLVRDGQDPGATYVRHNGLEVRFDAKDWTNNAVIEALF